MKNHSVSPRKYSLLDSFLIEIARDHRWDRHEHTHTENRRLSLNTIRSGLPGSGTQAGPGTELVGSHIRGAGYGIAAAVVLALAAGVAQASDVSGQVLGTTYATIMARAPGVIAGNLSRSGTAAHIAHAKLQASPPQSTCQSRPTAARRQLCTLYGTVWHEMVTTPACNGNPKCANVTTLGFMAKNKNPWFELFERALAWTILTYEAYDWCTSDAACEGTLENIGNQCNASDGYCQGTVPDIDLPDLSDEWDVENQPFNPGNPLAGYYAVIDVGYYESSLSYSLGYGTDATAVNDSYDAQWGYGPWGSLSEEEISGMAGETPCPVVTPYCP